MLKKINIPMVVLIADIAMKKDIEPNEFHDWFLYFFVSCKDYSQYCSSGSIKKEKVLGRLATMEAHFTKHFKLEDSAEAEAPESDEEIPETDSTDADQEEIGTTSSAEISDTDSSELVENDISTEETSGSKEAETSDAESESEESDSFMSPPADAETEEASLHESLYLIEQGA